MTDSPTLSFQKRLFRRKLAVASVVALIFVFLLVLNLASYNFVRRIGLQLEASLDSRLTTAAKLTGEVISNSVSSFYDPVDMQLLAFSLARLREDSELEAIYLVDRQLHVLVDAETPPPSRGYLRADSLVVTDAWRTGAATSAIHTVARSYFKNAYAVVTDYSGDTALLVIEANAGFFTMLQFYYGRLYLNSIISAVVFVVLTIFLILATSRFLRTEEELQKAQRLAAMGQMTATMAHEIRNPLGIIKSSNDVLREKYARTQPDELFEFVDEEIKRLSRLVNDFLAFSRQPILSPARHNLNNAIKDTITAFGAEKGVVVLFENENENLHVVFDADKIRQVLLNLLLNAAQAIGEGGGEICVSIRATRHRAKTFAEIQVRDNGLGINSDPEKIFEPFYTTKAQGTGLGLAVCRTIVEKHGGTITAKNGENGGAVFIVRLPKGE